MTASSLSVPTFGAATLSSLARAAPVFWANEKLDQRPDLFTREIDPGQIDAARARMLRFAPLLARLFPELRESGGQVASALMPVDRLQQALGLPQDSGRLWIKADHSLPVAGSVKARGGFHEVLEFAESLALRHGLVTEGDDYSVLAEAPVRELFSAYRIAVGSTGNLGMAIGIMAAALGFEAIVHMSAEAKSWKKKRLRDYGVQVHEHSGDYAQAVTAGRDQAALDAHTHFVDDESSLSLMLGYAVAGAELKSQLEQEKIAVDREHPLFVYLPCGVGGAPAGISVGLKQALGPHVHCFFAEPAQAPCFMLRMLESESGSSSVYDIGLNNRTEADGLAVPRASELASRVMRPLLSGCYTVQDSTLFEALALAKESQDLQLEPSAAAGLPGPLALTASESGRKWLSASGLLQHLPNATHVAWTTGGQQVPEEEYARFYALGRR